MMSGLKCSAQSLERLLVVDAERLLPVDESARVAERVGACRPRWRSGSRSTRSRSTRTSSDLGPPVEDGAVAEHAARRAGAGAARAVAVVGAGRGRSRVASARGRPPGRLWPTANAGAPSRLTSSVMPYQSRPMATACPVGTPSGWKRNASMPSRTPRPPTEIGSTWTIATAGTNASTAAFGTAHVEHVEGAVHRGHDRRAGTASAAPSATTASRGSRRRRSTPTCTAPMNRIQLSCSAKRPASLRVRRRGTGSRTGTRACRRRSATANERAVDVEEGRVDREAANTSSGSATKPVSRSSTTARERDRRCCRCRPSERLTRSTSPPIVDGSTFPTNWPAR